ncbi:MAG: DUF4369 domain-containing protein [Proteiniphilum sp.]
MKTKNLIVLLFLLFGLLLNTRASAPLIVEGQITNSIEPRLYMPIQLAHGLFDIDTIPLDMDGRFYHVTDRVTVPQKTDLRNNDIQLNNFFIAPGYHLTITGDGSDFFTLLKTARIEGSESNRYKMLHDSIMVARMDTTRWYELKGDSLLNYISEQKHFSDSLESVVFNKENSDDPYLAYFGEMTYLNNQFIRLYYWWCTWIFGQAGVPLVGRRCPRSAHFMKNTRTTMRLLSSG